MFAIHNTFKQLTFKHLNCKHSQGHYRIEAVLNLFLGYVMRVKKVCVKFDINYLFMFVNYI